MHKLNKQIATISGRILFLYIFMITASSVFAQVPNIGDAVKQTTLPPGPAEKEAPAPETQVIVQEAEKFFSLSEDEKIFVKDIKLDGAEEADATELSALLSPYKNRDLTMEEITQAANKLTLFYRRKGRLVAKAYVPKQDATDGILTIKIIMGNYGKFSLNNTSLVRDSVLQGVFDRTGNYSSIVTRDGLERAILLVGDMPGTEIPTVAIKPGAASGASDFDVEVDASQRFNGYIMADNQGSNYTGKNRVYGGADVNSPFGIADRLSVSGMTTEHSGMDNLRLSYGFPLFYNGLRAELAASRVTYELGGIYSDLDATGSADVVEGTISYPIKRSSSKSIDISLNLAYKDLQDDLDAVDLENPRNASVATLSLQREAYSILFGHNLSTAMSGSVNIGRLDIEDDTQKTLNEAGANTAGTYSRLNLAFSGIMEFTEKFSLKASAKIQKVLTQRNLDGTEQMFISGTTGVKAYTESVSFDNGYLVNGELLYALPSVFGVKQTAGLFFDNGWVRAQKKDYTTDYKIMISDVGLAYYLSFKQMFGVVYLAQPIGGSSVVSDPGTRVLMQVGIKF